VAAGDDLPQPLGGDLVNTAGEAFTQALQLAASLSAAILIAAAVLAWTLLRGREGREPEEEGVLDADRAVPDRSPCLPAESGISKVLEQAGA
jgi:hypothetical protein